MNNIRNKSLILCSSPLQMLIAEKIIKQSKNQSFDLVVVALNDNEKFKYYFERLKKLCVNSFYFLPNGSKLSFLEFIKKLKKNNLHLHYDNIFLANIDSRHFQYIVSKNDGSNIYTFDDGIANILSSSRYYSKKKLNLFKKLMWRALGIKYNMDDIKSLSITHYTIYENLSNINKKRNLIKLFQETTPLINTPEEKVKIFIGQPLHFENPQLTEEIVSDIINSLKIDFYYPHPRERSIPKGNFEVINSPLIFEDYIISYLEDNPKKSVEIFSFYSSIGLNIANLDRVTFKYCYTDELYLRYKQFYEIANKNFSIPIFRVQ